MKKTIILLCLLWCAALPGWGQDLITNTRNGNSARTEVKEPNAVAQLIEDRKNQQADFRAVQLLDSDPTEQNGAYSNVVSDAVFLQLNRSRLQRFLSNPAKDLLLSIPVGGGRSIELELTQVNIVSPDFKVTTSAGRVEFSAPTGYFYHGIVKGDAASLAALSVFGDEIRVLMADANGNYILNALQEGRRVERYVLYNDRNLRERMEPFCQTGDNELPPPRVRAPKAAAEKALTKCVKVYLEIDFQLYNRQGSTLLDAVNYAFSIFNESAIVYYNEEIPTEISEIFVWDVQDPYAGTACDDLLDAFVANRPTFNGNLAHLMSSKVTTNPNGTTSSCGKAFGIGGICGSTSGPGPYCVSTGLRSTVGVFPTYTWELNVFTHEMGHVLGSFHTHRCAWNSNGTQIDDCGNVFASNDGNTPEGDSCFDEDNPIIPANGGFIMSYCHIDSVGSFMNFSLGFGQQSGDVIRNTIMLSDCLGDDCSCDEFVSRTVNGNPIPSAVYTARNSITSVGDANAPANNIVVFRAGNLIELTAGFEATELFIAEVIPTLCDVPGSSLAFIPDNAFFAQTGAETPDAVSLTLFPNPASTEIQLAYRLPVDGAVAIRVFNQYGQLVKTIEDNTLQQRGEFQLTVPLYHWPSGIYYVVLGSAGEQAVRPFAVNRF